MRRGGVHVLPRGTTPHRTGRGPHVSPPTSTHPLGPWSHLRRAGSSPGPVADGDGGSARRQDEGGSEREGEAGGEHGVDDRLGQGDEPLDVEPLLGARPGASEQ